MRKIIGGIIILVIILISCSKKSLPVITERKTTPPLTEKKSITVPPDSARGKIIYTNRCGRCHDLPKPDLYKMVRWESIMSYMGPRARLDEEQTIHVMAFLQANAAK